VLESSAPMKLTILGSGTLVPNGERNSAGYFVETADARVMLDCGAGTVHALARYGLPWERLTHLFVSHFHVDHIGELASLFLAFRHGLQTPRLEPLVVIGPRGLDRVMEGLRHAFGAKLFDLKFPVELRMLVPGETVELGPESVLSVAKTPHTEESLAVRIDSSGKAVCYTGDTSFTEELSSFFSEADVLVSECSFRARRDEAAHLSVEEAARMASLSKAVRLIVTHFFFHVRTDELVCEIQQSYDGEVLIGRDGLTLEI
jgi:ribonuclease BN (tRNA processing enzyme)